MVVPCAIAVVIAVSVGLLGQPWEGRREASERAAESSQRAGEGWERRTGRSWVLYEDAFRSGWFGGCYEALRQISLPEAYAGVCAPPPAWLDSAIPPKPPTDPESVGDRRGWRAGCIHALAETGSLSDWCTQPGRAAMH